MENQHTINRAPNFRLLRYLRGTHKKLVEDLKGIASWNEVSDFAWGQRRINEYTARAIEKRLKLPEGWLDRDHATYLNASADAQSLFALVNAAPPQVREAIRTILEHGNGGSSRSEANRPSTGAQLRLVQEIGSALRA